MSQRSGAHIEYRVVRPARVYASLGVWNRLFSCSAVPRFTCCIKELLRSHLYKIVCKCHLFFAILPQDRPYLTTTQVVQRSGLMRAYLRILVA